MAHFLQSTFFVSYVVFFVQAAAAEIAGARGDEGYLKSGADGGIARDEAAKL